MTSSGRSAVRGGRRPQGGVDPAALETLRTIDHLERRNRRWELKLALWKLSKLPRVRHCGKYRIAGANGVGLRYSDGRAGYAGLQTCGSVWACPMCAVKVGAVRAVEIGTVVHQAAAQGFDVAMMTFTIRHDRSQALRPLWDAVAGCWHSTVNRRGWDLDVARHGVEGWVRANEVTWGLANGWHPHVHALVIAAPGFDVEALGTSMWRRWASAAERAGLDAPLIRGSEWHRVTGAEASSTMGEYLSKGPDAAGAVGRELVASTGKTARSRHSTITPWQVLKEFIDNGEVHMGKTWGEWELASKGRRQLGWSKGVRDRFGVGAERADEDIAGDELGSADDTVCVITPKGWDSLVKRPWLIPKPLEVLELEGWDALQTWLLANGVEYTPVYVGTCEHS